MRSIKTTIVISIVLFLVNPVFSQKIEKGTYQSFLGYNIDPITHKESYYFEYGEKISFLDDSLFEYNYLDDITNDIGKGVYKISSNTLTLKFKKMTIADSALIKILESKQSSEDSITLKFIVKDLKFGSRLGGAIIFCKNYVNDFLDSMNLSSFGCETNMQGVAGFKLAKNKLPCEIRVSYVGYKGMNFLLKDSLDKTFEISMVEPYHVIPAGKIIQYRIKNIDEESFYLIDGIWYEWTYFKKID